MWPRYDKWGISGLFSSSKRHLWCKGKVKMVILKPTTSKKRGYVVTFKKNSTSCVTVKGHVRKWTS